MMLIRQWVSVRVTPMCHYAFLSITLPSGVAKTYSDTYALLYVYYVIPNTYKRIVSTAYETT